MGLEIDYIFHPKSIAVAGASANKDKSGYRFFKSLLDLGYEGALYPVNNKGDEILEHKVYSRVQDIPGPVDYVISCVPNNAASVSGTATLCLPQSRCWHPGCASPSILLLMDANGYQGIETVFYRDPCKQLFCTGIPVKNCFSQGSM